MMFIYINDEDLNNTPLMEKRIETLEGERVILDAKLEGVKEYIRYIKSKLAIKKIKHVLSEQGIKEHGDKIELNYSDGKWVGVTMGIEDDKYMPCLNVHLMLKSRKGWYKDIWKIYEGKIDVIRKATIEIPDSPKMPKT